MDSRWWRSRSIRSGGRFDPKSFIECDLDVQSVRPAKPKVKFRPKDCCTDIEKIFAYGRAAEASSAGASSAVFQHRDQSLKWCV